MVNEMLSFLKKTPSVFHAIRNLGEMLEKEGFERLDESGKWQLKNGGKYYVTRNLSSLIGFIVPEKTPDCLMITASHCDSPVFKLKENAELEVRGRYVQLDTERYGGLIYSSWLDRPLSMAGRVLVRTDKGVETRLIDLDKDAMLIPNVAIHMQRDLNDGHKYNPQSELLPLYSDINSKGKLKAHIAELAGVKEEDILGHDIFLYSRTAPMIWGPNEEFVSAGRLDDLECAYTTVKAITLCHPTGSLPVVAVFDNEEVGSTTKQGADSTFLTDVLHRITLNLGMDEEAFQRLRASSLMVSCDNAHAMHPHHPEYSDSANTVYMNEGIVIKESANQKYTSDGVSKALLRSILEKAGVPCQFFANRSDMQGGGTLGNISNSHFSLNTVDIGLAQLSMHSTYETAGTRDVEYMINGMKAVYEADLITNADGDYELK